MLNNFNFIKMLFSLVILLPCLCYSFHDESIYNLKSKLIDRNGETIEIGELSGKIHILSMIYTNCKTICPIIISNMKAIEKLIPAKYSDDVVFTLITLDPDRDDANTLNKYFKEKKLTSGKWFIYKTSKEETLRIALAIGIKYKKDEKNDEYIHSNLIIILDRDGIVKLHHQGLDKSFNNIIKTIDFLF